MIDLCDESAMRMGPAARDARPRYTVTGLRLAVLSVVIFAGLLIAGCGDGQAGGGASAKTGGTTGGTSGGTGVATSGATGASSTRGSTGLGLIDQGTVGGYRATSDKLVVVRTDSAYGALERRVHSTSRGTAGWLRVDFSKNMVAAVFLAPGKGGESVLIGSIKPRGSGFVVNASRTVPGRNCVVAAVITHPYVVVQATRLSGKPRLRLRTVKHDC